MTVAITDAYAAPTMLQDAQKYNQVHDQPLFGPGQFRQITPAPDGYDIVDLCGAQGWYGEETLDVEAVHAMAPGAKVVYVGAADCIGGLDNAWADIDRQPRRRRRHQLVDRRHRRHHPAQHRLRRRSTSSSRSRPR